MAYSLEIEGLVAHIHKLEAHIKELEKQKDALLVRVLSQCKGDCAAASK
jgi:cell division protein FtsB